MGDTVSAACHAKDALNADGFCMIVEPFANDQRQENLNPVGKAFYAFSTMICIPASLGQEVGSGLGARAGYKRLKSVLKSGGFRHIKKSPETPFNLTIEAR